MSMKPDDPRNNPVHFPPDRRLRIWVRPSILIPLLAICVAPIVAAWMQYTVAGLPDISGMGSEHPNLEPQGFPAWLRTAHYVNFLFLVLLFRSGLSILMDHPRLYWNDHCTPGTEWLRLTPVVVPTDRVWTAKDDARYISPWLALPGYRHTIGTARHCHLLAILFWATNGAIFVALLFVTGQWSRLVPLSPEVISEAWAVFVHYATLHVPDEPGGFYRYNPLQQLAYFGVVFIMAPLSALTGLAMSPAIDSRFRWYPRLFGGRQPARSIHFLLATGYGAFLIVHVTLVVATGFARNMNNIVMGRDDHGPAGIVFGLIGIAAVVLACYVAHRASWKHSRALQYLVRHIHSVMRRLVFRHLAPQAQFDKSDISPLLWPNGKVPTSDEWKRHLEDDFRDFRLTVGGMVEHPVSLSLQELKAMERREQITMHHCIQGWSGIAQWAGVPLSALVERVRPLPDARVVVFHSFGEGLYGDEYYDTQQIENVLHEQCILAYEMNEEPLGVLYGAPLRLRVENQLGYKMVKWVKSIEFVASAEDVGEGHGGKNEDDEYFDLIPEI